MNRISKPRIEWAVLSHSTTFIDTLNQALAQFSRARFSSSLRSDTSRAIGPQTEDDLYDFLVVIAELNDSMLSREELFKEVCGNAFAPGEVIYLSRSATTEQIVAAMKNRAYSVIDESAPVSAVARLISEIDEIASRFKASHTAINHVGDLFRIVRVEREKFGPICVLDAAGETVYLNQAFREYLVSELGLPPDEAAVGLNWLHHGFPGAFLELGQFGDQIRSRIERGNQRQTDFVETFEFETALIRTTWEIHFRAESGYVGVCEYDEAIGARELNANLLRMAADLTNTPFVNLDVLLADCFKKTNQIVGSDGVLLFTSAERENIFQLKSYIGDIQLPAHSYREFENFNLDKWTFHKNYLQNEAVITGDSEVLPPEFRSAQELRGKAGVRASVDIPIFLNGELAAIMGVVTFVRVHEWTDPILRYLFNLSEIVYECVRRRRLDMRLRDGESEELLHTRDEKEPSFGYALDIPVPLHLPLSYQISQLFEARLVYCNEAYARYYGANSVHELIGRKWVEIMGGYKGRAFRIFARFLRKQYLVQQDLSQEEMYEDGIRRKIYYKARGIVRDGTLREVWGTFYLMEVYGAAVEVVSDKGRSFEVHDTREVSYAESSLSPEHMAKVETQILGILTLERPYREHDFSLKRLAKMVNCSTYQLAQVINVQMHTNFCDLADRFRVDDFCELLALKGNETAGILDMAVQVGFNSKTGFNNSFMKVRGMTPERYRETLHPVLRKPASSQNR